MSELVTSFTNPLIKRARSLADRKHRRKLREFLVEGQQPVWRAVTSGADVRALIYAPDLLTFEPALAMLAAQDAAGVRVTPVSADVFATLTDRDHPTGIAAIVGAPHPAPTLDDIPLGDDSVVMVMEAPSNPGNIGTVIRTCDAAGIAAVVLVGDAADPYAPTAVKASMGSVFAVPVVACGTDDLLAWSRGHGVRLIATAGAASRAHWDVVYDGPVALLLGNEGQGLSAALLDAADEAVRIPMTGTAESLNLSVAAGILAYEVRRARRWE